MTTQHNGIPPADTALMEPQQRLDMLGGVFSALAGPGAFSERLTDAARLTCLFFRASFCIARSLEDDGLHLLACHGVHRDRMRSRVPAQWGLCGEILSTRKPVIVDDISSDALATASANAFPEPETITAYAGLPLLVGDRAIGVLEYHFLKNEHSRSPYKIELLNILANIIALAVENERSARKLEEQREEIDLHLEERRETQVELLHAQKLESVGRLATEVAHDFNNMLTVILGFNSMVRDELKDDHHVQEHLEKIGAACIRTAALTRQLLTYARRESISPTIVKLKPMIRDTAQMLVPLLGPGISLQIETRPGMDTVLIDSGQMQHLLVNLMVNARDAMQGRGVLTLKLNERTIGPTGSAVYGSLVPGSYLCIEVADTGCGMSEEVRRRIFEPFFTTKVQGKGTGLGLATCASTVRQNHGDIEVDSVQGKGTTFRILLPCAFPSQEAAETVADLPLAFGGTEAVLVVDSERWVREAAVRNLRQYGYRAEAADSGREALETALAWNGDFAVLATETMLHDMTGQELAMRMSYRYSHIRTLFLSGWGESGQSDSTFDDARRSPFQKPYSPIELARKVRELVDSVS